MLSDEHNSITAKAKGLIFSLFDVASALLENPNIYNACMLRGLTCVLLCVPFIFADSARCQFMVAPHVGFPCLIGNIRVFFVTGLMQTSFS